MNKNMTHEFSWNNLFSWREKICSEYPDVFDLKIRKKIIDIIRDELKTESRILDVGANRKGLGEELKAAAPSCTYKTMDIDRSVQHDYYTLEEVEGKFDIIILSEVIEHVSAEDGLSMLKDLAGLLTPGGKIIISTPNISHPNRFWDLDHITPYRYDELGGILLSLGYDISGLYRIYNDQFFKRAFRMYITSHIHRYLDIDFAKSIVIVAGRQ
ncbi:MAG: class I SAM-dependent methyltransferase [Nitrospira sp.]|nr:class I SAM-dependent methyltransferase [bacterium]MBL7049049.1 class I SAM-dependent methyltransferase [Nitrospira sp.]